LFKLQHGFLRFLLVLLGFLLFTDPTR